MSDEWVVSLDEGGTWTNFEDESKAREFAELEASVGKTAMLARQKDEGGYKIVDVYEPKS